MPGNPGMISRKFFCSTERARCLYIIYIYIFFFTRSKSGVMDPLKKYQALKFVKGSGHKLGHVLWH
jgi:hypothetical protein